MKAYECETFATFDSFPYVLYVSMQVCVCMRFCMGTDMLMCEHIGVGI